MLLIYSTCTFEAWQIPGGLGVESMFDWKKEIPGGTVHVGGTRQIAFPLTSVGELWLFSGTTHSKGHIRFPSDCFRKHS